MQNHWKKKHLNRTYSDQSFYDNCNPIVLSWEGLDNQQMPIIRTNYTEMQATWAIYVTGLELERMERYGRSNSQIC